MPLRIDVVLDHEAFTDDMQNEFLTAIEAMPERQRAVWYENAAPNEDAELLIGQTLVWRNTPQGSDYWSAVLRNISAENAGRPPGALPEPDNRRVREVPVPPRPEGHPVGPAPAPARRRGMWELDVVELQRLGDMAQPGGIKMKKRKSKSPPVDEIECEEL